MRAWGERWWRKIGARDGGASEGSGVACERFAPNEMHAPNKMHAPNERHAPNEMHAPNDTCEGRAPNERHAPNAPNEGCVICGVGLVFLAVAAWRAVDAAGACWLHGHFVADEIEAQQQRLGLSLVFQPCLQCLVKRRHLLLARVWCGRFACYTLNGGHTWPP